jgi:serine/threonine-protein kinase
VFIAMEYVDGKTLRAWQAEDERSWRDVVDVYLQAARGLAAAHDAGLVHRDFKPDNAMIGREGVVRVLDFGIALAAGWEGGPTSPQAGACSEDGDATPATNRFAGTPAYMAPEQLRGRPTDARADLFSFCVALYEALLRRHPFAARSLPALVTRVLDGAIEPIPRGARVPRRILQQVMRGLAAEPDARPRDMKELVAALERDRVRGWLRAGVFSAGTLALGAVAYGVVLGDDDAFVPCEYPESELAGVWDDDARRHVAQRFVELDLEYASAAWDRVDARLHDYAQAWVAQRTDACEAAHVRHTASTRTLDVRMACLDRRRDALLATVEVLATLDRSTVRWSSRIVDSLPSLGRCADETALLADVAPPEDAEAASEVEDIRAQLERVRALDAAGRYDEAVELARAALDRANGVAHAPVIAEALERLAAAELGAGTAAAAERHYEDAYFTALSSGHDEVAVGAAVALVSVVGMDRPGREDASTWARHAQALVDRAGRPAEARARLANGLGILAHQRGDAEEALRHHERALGLRRELYGDAHPSVAASINNLANVHATQGQEGRAAELYRRALRIERRQLGPAHPEVAATHSNLARALAGVEQLDEAQEHLERALAIQSEALGPAHPEVARALGNLGNVHFARHQLDAAARAYEDALAIFERHHGPDHAEVASALINVAGVHAERGDLERAEATLFQGLETLVRTAGEHHPEVGRTWYRLAILATMDGRVAVARDRYQRALVLLRPALGPGHPELGSIETELAALAK